MKTIKIFATILCTLTCLLAAAQTETVTMKSNDNIDNKLSTKTKYAFPEFTFGTVYFKNDPEASGKLNYNYLSNTIQFLDNDEIKDVANQKSILLVQIGQTEFVPVGKGFGKVVFEGKKVSLIYNRQIIINEKRDLGYGGKTSTASVQNVTTIDSKGFASDGSATSLADMQQNVNITANDQYFLEKDAKMMPATKKGFYKCFPDLKAEIDQYISNKDFKFTSENDLIQLLIYLTNLQTK